MKKIIKIIILFIILENVFAETEFDYKTKIHDLIEKKQFVIAEQKIEEFLAKYPSRDNYFFSAKAYLLINKKEIAKKYWFKNISDWKDEVYRLQTIFYKYSLYDELEELYKKMVELYPRKRIFSFQLLKIYRALNKIEDFFLLINHLIRLEKKFSPEIRKELKDFSFELSKKSIFFLEKFINNPFLESFDRLFIFEIIAEIYFKEKDYNKYLEIKKKLFEDDYYNEDDAYDFFKKIIFFSDENSVIDIIVFLINKYKNNSELSYNFSLYLFKKKKYRLLVELFENRITYLKNNFKNDLFYLLSQACLILFDFQKAEFFLSKINIATPQKNYINALMHLYNEKYEEAYNLFNKTDMSEKYFYIFHILLFQNKINESFEYLEKWISKTYEAINLYKGFEIKLILNEIKNNNELLSIYISTMKKYFSKEREKIIDIFDLNKNSILKYFFSLKIAEHYINLENFEKAIYYLKNISNNNFFYQKAQYLKAFIYLKNLNKKTKAINIINSLLLKYPDTIFKNDILLLLKNEKIINHELK